ncbi:hypothetical protein H7I87_19665 [Mycobacterium timonense]|uniref:Transposase n=2 Tax=Mycobacterium avium complex (MAC) TaxID=120793 RepID=A0AAW5SDW0_MYCBC|nr:hypothetical protein [Mycobacterium avium subsp. hominissuis]MCV6992728.1 hypothetical protein [Mycobacterium bouchedurhonense]MCV6996895.1 hypothetical protein [Mycobacterium timonense]MCV7034857.1 hypothetical protein [Mycobacterium heckeshornense]MCV7101841.1 hypothetical protein [Mycobacterium palustre]PBA42286.1 hypothetical protein CKJ63_07535 [Mycobacterium avium]TXA41096.1 hypothetical protein DKM27_15080 [Mycobacterium tuberculosis variant bovis]
MNLHRRTRVSQKTDRANRVERLAAAAAARTAEAESRARRAIIKLETAGQPVSFVSVARTGRVSTSFLYQHPELREEIVRHRNHSRRTPRPAPEKASADSLRAKLRVAMDRCAALTAEVAELRAENEALRSTLIARGP